MARGYPDYFGLPMFPEYGSLNLESSGTITIVADATEIITLLSLKGRIYGGTLKLYTPTLDIPTYAIRITIDGTLLINPMVHQILDRNTAVGFSGLLQLTEYNMEEGYFLFTYNKDIVFGYQFLIEVLNGTINDVGVDSDLIYAKIV